MRLPSFFITLLFVGATARRYHDSSSSEEDNGEVSESRLVLSKISFDQDAYSKMKIPRLSESLSGQELVDYINRRQDLWIVSYSIDSQKAIYNVIKGNQ